MPNWLPRPFQYSMKLPTRRLGLRQQFQISKQFAARSRTQPKTFQMVRKGLLRPRRSTSWTTIWQLFLGLISRQSPSQEHLSKPEISATKPERTTLPPRGQSFWTISSEQQKSRPPRQIQDRTLLIPPDSELPMSLCDPSSLKDITPTNSPKWSKSLEAPRREMPLDE